MAQFGRALRSGRRSRGFESRHLDQKEEGKACLPLFFFVKVHRFEPLKRLRLMLCARRKQGVLPNIGAKLGSESRHLDQQKRNFCLPKVPFLFIQAAGLAYHRDAVVDIISPFGAVSHHAPACIFLRN